MRNELKIQTGVDYFEAKGLEIDWEDEHKGAEGWVSIEEERSVHEIVSCEVAYWVTRRLTHSCQSISDTMYDLREKLIIAHDKKYTDYEKMQIIS